MEFRFSVSLQGHPSTFHQEWYGDHSANEPNPWLHYRLTGRFEHVASSRVLYVPGFFDTDGGNVNSTALSGNVWTIRFAPTLIGDWDLDVYFENGQNINVADLVTPLSCTGALCTSTSFEALARDTSAPGFLSEGILKADDTAHYLRFVREPTPGTIEGPYFMKTGMGSPENLFGYEGFTGTADGEWANCEQAGSPDPAEGILHDFQVTYATSTGPVSRNHTRDWELGMPDWSANGTTEQGQAIIGAIAYLANEGLNGIYVLPMNLGGDGHDTHPFARVDAGTCGTPPCAERTEEWEVLGYHAKRMREWNTVFEFCMRQGVMVQLILAEQELCNMNWLKDPATTNPSAPATFVGRMRKLYLKQMIALFGHNVALVFNLCEENRIDPTYSPPFNEFTADELEVMAQWILMWDAYGHPITVHDKVGTYDHLVRSSPPRGQWLRLTCIGTGPESATSFWANPAWDYSVQAEAAYHGGQNWGYVNSSSVKTIATIDEHGFWETAIAPIVADLPANASLSFTENAFSKRDSIRRRILYDVLFSGASLSWYFGWMYEETDGGNDLNCEDFRSRASLYSDTRIARKFLEKYVSFAKGFPDDAALGGSPTPHSDFGLPEVFRRTSPSQWLIYYPAVNDGSGTPVASLGTIGYSGHSSWGWKWLDPLTGNVIASDYFSASSGTFDPLTVLPDAVASTPNKDLVFYLFGL